MNIHVRITHNGQHIKLAKAYHEGHSHQQTQMHLAFGMIFDEMPGVSRADLPDFSIWVDGVCLHAFGAHRPFASTAELDVDWSFGGTVTYDREIDFPAPPTEK